MLQGQELLMENELPLLASKKGSLIALITLFGFELCVIYLLVITLATNCYHVYYYEPS